MPYIYTFSFGWWKGDQNAAAGREGGITGSEHLKSKQKEGKVNTGTALIFVLFILLVFSVVK